MTNRLPFAWQFDQINRDTYETQQALFRQRVQVGEDPEAVRASMLDNLDRFAMLCELATDDAADGLNQPEAAIQAVMKEYPLPAGMENL